jgi:hypothetical protein
MGILGAATAVPTRPAADTPDRATVLDVVTVPTLPAADTPVSAKDSDAVTEPTAPDAATPVSATSIVTATVPTLPAAATPVSAAVPVPPAAGRAENGTSENAELPNMSYGYIEITESAPTESALVMLGTIHWQVASSNTASGVGFGGIKASRWGS